MLGFEDSSFCQSFMRFLFGSHYDVSSRSYFVVSIKTTQRKPQENQFVDCCVTQQQVPFAERDAINVSRCIRHCLGKDLQMFRE